MTTTMGIPLVHDVHGGMTGRRSQEKRKKECLFGVFFPSKVARPTSYVSHQKPRSTYRFFLYICRFLEKK